MKIRMVALINNKSRYVQCDNELMSKIILYNIIFSCDIDARYNGIQQHTVRFSWVKKTVHFPLHYRRKKN